MFKEGELVFLIDLNGKKHWLRVTKSMLKIPSLGIVNGDNIINLEDGSELTIAGKKLTVFRPGTIDLIESLNRGAQIITPKDAASILFNCDIKTGDVVLEIGTGSGALTTALISAVKPKGRVHTVELVEKNVLITLKNLKRTGLDEKWTYQIGDARNVKVSILADALVMDIPDPEKALENLLPCLRNGGRICAYIPNTNQVELIVNALRCRNFYDVFSLEILQRKMEVHHGGVRPAYEMLGHTGYLVFGRKRS
ncbi:MAG: methyltransferase domain-containing protein [archaeon]|nr:methyltransferase domain-containing protein [archaeon]